MRSTAESIIVFVPHRANDEGGNPQPLWLRLENNVIRDPDAVLDENKDRGVTHLSHRQPRDSNELDMANFWIQNLLSYLVLP